ncbi:MAG: hypothetical protein WC732_04685 [Candidatus Omnitrophota bacterium]
MAVKNTWIMLLFGFLLFSPADLRAQETKDEPNYDIMAQEMAQDRKKALLVEYKAVRDENIDACKEAYEQKDCREEAVFLLNFRYIAEGSCGKISDRDFADICEHMKKNDCGALDQGKAEICSGLQNENFSLFSQGSVKFAKSKKFQAPKEIDNRKAMGCYMGFKYFSSQTACEKIMTNVPYDRTIFCSALFGTGPSDQILDELGRDLAYYNLRESAKKKELCEKIKHFQLQDKCRKLR